MPICVVDVIQDLINCLQKELVEVWCGAGDNNCPHCSLSISEQFFPAGMTRAKERKRCLGTRRQGGSQTEPRLWTSLSLIQILAPGAAEVPFIGTP